MQLSIVAKTIGLLLMVFSFAQVPPIIIDLIYSEGEYFSFLLSFALTGLGGLILWWPFKNTKKEFRLREGVLIVVCFWIVLSLSLIHISEPTRRRGISYAVFCLKKKK